MNVNLFTKWCQHKINEFDLLKKILTPWEKIEVEKQNYVEQHKQNFTCKEYESLSFKIVQLKRVPERYENGKIGLDDVLSQ